jgi:hypothetical protein
MIDYVVSPSVIADIKKNSLLKQKLAEINGIEAPAVDALLRPSKVNGRPHSQKLCNFKNLVAIMEAYGYARFDDFLIEIDIPL